MNTPENQRRVGQIAMRTKRQKIMKWRMEIDRVLVLDYPSQRTLIDLLGRLRDEMKDIEDRDAKLFAEYMAGGEHGHQARLAIKYGVSRARVSQIIDEQTRALDKPPEHAPAPGPR